MADIQEVLAGQKRLADKYYQLCDEIIDAVEGAALTGLELRSRFETREDVIRDCLLDFIAEYDGYAVLVERHFECRRATLVDTSPVREIAERVVVTSTTRGFLAVIVECYDVIKSVGRIDRWA